MAQQDFVTRERVLRVAARLFAAQGFSRVTVRDICAEAGANVAAVNYHFGDKQRLYNEVLDRAAATIQQTTELARTAAEGCSAEERLRIYIRTFLERAFGPLVQDRWIHQLMTRELSDPTPAMTRFGDQGIRPRLDYVASIVADLLGRPAGDPAVGRCVLSIQAQLHGTLAHEMVRHLVPDVGEQAGLGGWVEHIAAFSLAGIRALAEPPVAAGSAAGRLADAPRGAAG